MEKLKNIVRNFPDSPGIYKFIGKDNEILYVGKAKSLRKRVLSYFLGKNQLQVKITKLIEKTEDISYDLTKSEEEALFLEDELIKNHQPMFNILLRDDKTYPFIYVSTQEKFPRVLFSHRAMSGEGHYYGPFTSSGMVKEILTQIRKTYPYRDCSLDVGNKTYKESCIYEELGLCTAPCIGKDTQEHYRETIKNICDFLEGKQKKLMNDIYLAMQKASREQNFEKAARLKDQWLLAKNIFTQGMLKPDSWSRQINDGLKELKERLGLTKEISTMEAYDISNISGKYSVGVSVMFKDGRPNKSGYRKFRIRTVPGPDDFAMMEEVIERRFAKRIKDQEPIPDLVLIDGGKGQLTAALHVFKKLNLENVLVIALAKKEELVFCPGKPDPVILGRTSFGRKLLQAIRDEAHRFAITYHRTLRSNVLLRSVIEDIDGIGEKTKKNLLAHMGSLDAIQKAGIEDLLKIPGIGAGMAAKIYKAFKKKQF